MGSVLCWGCGWSGLVEGAAVSGGERAVNGCGWPCWLACGSGVTVKGQDG